MDYSKYYFFSKHISKDFVLLFMTVLKPIELKILKLVCSDNSNADIAKKIEFSLRYTEKLKTALFLKTKTSSNVGLLKWAIVNNHFIVKAKTRK